MKIITTFDAKLRVRDLPTVCRILFISSSSVGKIFFYTYLPFSKKWKILSEKYQIHPDAIRAYIKGEHGKTQFPVISAAYMGGVKIDLPDDTTELMNASKSSAYHIVKGKGYTNYAIAMAASLVVESIAKNENRTMPLSTLVDGYMGVDNVCLSMPVVNGRNGITKRLRIALDDKEQLLFKKSARDVQNELAKLIE
jgi:L-lactate dehydrogenase